MFRRFCAIALFILLAGIGAFGPALRAEDEKAGFVATNPAETLPSLSIEDEHGQTVDLKNLRGRYVLLNLWATWCGPCAAEMPALDSLRQKLDAKKFEVVALNEDRDGASVAPSFYKRHSIDHLAVYVDPHGRAPVMLHARGLPTTILIGPDGLEIARLEGETDWNSRDMVDYLGKLARPN
jgi:thiol-disulfide isomerase/thioredoxin